MKRTELRRKSALVRTPPMRRRRKPLREFGRPEDAYAEQRAIWKDPHAGFCQCGCERWCLHLDRHHVVPAEYIKREKRFDLLFDLRNSILISRQCHANHHSAFRRLSLSAVPMAARVFAIEFLGEDRALDFFVRTYSA